MSDSLDSDANNGFQEGKAIEQGTAPGVKVHMHWLDAVRFLAALFVLIEHARGVAFQSWGDLDADSRTPVVMVFFALARLGTEAVVVFFVLSGLLVGGPGFSRILAGRFQLRDYVIDRLVRLIVPLVPAVALTLLVSLMLQDYPGSILQIIGNILFLQGLLVDALSNNSPMWTLAYEFWFYFLVAALFLLTKRAMSGFVAICIFLLVFRYFHPVFLFSWLIGAAVFFLTARQIGGLTVILAAALLAFFVAGGQIASVDPVRFGWIQELQPVFCMSVVVALILRYLSDCKPGKLMAPIERLLGQCGKFSYTLYLTHFPLLAMLRELLGVDRSSAVDAETIGIYVSLIVISLALAVLFYLLFERHTQAVKVWLKRTLSRRATSDA